MTYYIKGGSRYNEANPSVWCALNLLGFLESKYLDANWKQIDYENIIDSNDPFWLMGSVSGGSKEFELGLYSGYRIRFKTTGIEYYDGTWKDLLAEGGASSLNELDDVVITTPADNELLTWNDSSSKWINQTAAEAGLAVSGHNHAHNSLSGLNDGDNYEHITQGQKDLLHAIYTLEVHNNDYHDPDHLIDPILLTEIAEQDAPAANKLVMWAEDENGHTVLRYKESDGCEVNIGEDMYVIGKNTSGAEIVKGKIVYFNGTSTGKHPNFSLAKADALATMPAIGIVQATVANNGFTRVMIKGRLSGLNTPWANGTMLYVSSTVAGGYTNTFPPSPSIDQQIGIVEVNHALTGVLLVDFRQMQGRNDGTIRQSFQIGDGASGDVTLGFNGDAGNDGSIIWDVNEDQFVFNYDINVPNIITAGLVDGIDVSAIRSFKTITGITNNVIADNVADTLTLTSANNKLSIVGTSATDTITFTINEGNIVHDNLSGYDANKHIDHTGVTITAGTGLSGGGTIAASRTINCDITQYTNALAVAAVLAADKYIKNYENDATTGILTVSKLLTGDDGMFHSGDADTGINFLANQVFIIAGGFYMSLQPSGLQFNGVDARINEFDTDVNLAGGNTKVPTDLAVKTYHDNHKTVAGDLNLNDLAEKDHVSLANRGADDHHVAFVQANADALYSVLAHLHDGRYYTETEINNIITALGNTYYTETEIDANTYTRAQVDALNHDHFPNPNGNAEEQHMTAAQIAALHAIVTEVYKLRATDDRDFKPNTAATWRFIKAYFTTLAGMTGEADNNYQDLLILNTYSDGSGGDMNALTFDKSEKLIRHWLADQTAGTWGTPKTLAYVEDTYTQAQVDTADDNHQAAAEATASADATTKANAIGDRFDEQSNAFPGAPVEGDFHYDEDDDSLYRYNAEAGKWIEVGVMGAIASSIDNLGNHIATQDLDMATFRIINQTYVAENTTERSTGSTTYTKLKEITANFYGSLTVAWKFYGTNQFVQSTTRIYKNGVALGAINNTYETSYITMVETIAGIEPDDLIQIYAKRDSADLETVYVKDFIFLSNPYGTINEDF